MKLTRPMLAGTINDINKLRYPVLASPKLDGVRCIMVDGKALSRSFKPIPNNYIRETLEKYFHHGADGELMIPGASFNEIQSVVMSRDAVPERFQFCIFDFAKDLSLPFEERLYAIRNDIAAIYKGWGNTEFPYEFVVVEQRCVNTPAELLAYEEECLAAGYEGVMLRDPRGPYKCGRSTLKEGYLLKLKRFADSEAEIIGLEEQQKNTNTKEVNELGLTKRSSKKAGKVGAGTLGFFKVRDLYSGVEFEIGTGEGLTQELRKEIWENQNAYLGKIVKYKYQPSGGKDKPRFPVWLGFREKEDLG